MELREQGDELQRVEESMVAQVRVMDVLQRAANKKQRQMDVDRTTLDQQESFCEATTARHRRDSDRSVSVLGTCFGLVSFVFMRDSLIPLPF